MKRLPLLLLALCAALPAGRAELTPQVLKRARSRIEQLLGPRRNPPAPPADPANPFLAPGPAQAVATAETPVVSDTDTVKRLAGLLKINGFVQIQGIPHLIIDRLPYKENDLVAVKERSGTFYLRLKKITARTYILELNGKEFQSSLNAR